MHVSKMGGSGSYHNRSRRRRTRKTGRDSEQTISDRTSLDDAKLIKIIHGSVLDLVTMEHAENKEKI